MPPPDATRPAIRLRAAKAEDLPAIVALIADDGLGRGRDDASLPLDSSYVRAFDEIRSLFAVHPLSRARGYTPATFSFNAPKGGRCGVCEDAGVGTPPAGRRASSSTGRAADF